MSAGRCSVTAMERGDSRGFELSTERARWMIERPDVISIAEALDDLQRKRSIANVIERGHYVYGRI